jgi:hypothetical protein
MSIGNELTPAFGADYKRRLIVRRLAGCAAGILLAGTAIHSGVGFALAPLNPALASAVAPGHAGTLSSLTQLRFLTARSRQQLPAVSQLARQTIEAAPLDHSAARTIAAIDLVSNRPQRAERLFKLVGDNTLRDAMTHAWLLNFAFRDRDFDRVVREADVVLRLDAKLRPAAFAALNQLVADGNVIPTLAKTLEGNPPWRAGYLSAMGQEQAARSNQLRLFTLLRRGPTPPTAEELRTFFLTNANSTPLAQLTREYRALSPHQFAADEQRMRDGNFEGTRAFGPFTWTYFSGESGFAEVGTSPTGVGRSLYIEFEGRRQATAASQFLTLTPGSYTLSLRAFALDELRGQTVIQIGCQADNGSRRPLANLPIRGSLNEWRTNQLYFEVPEGCGGPIIDFVWRAATLSRPEQLYVDDLVIRPTARRPQATAPAPSTETGGGEGGDAESNAASD